MGNLTLFLPLLVVMGAFMFFASRRQKKAMQATMDLHDSLSIGDRVHTSSGMEATIAGLTDDTVDLEIAPGVITTWMKLAVRDRIEPDVDDDTADDADDLGDLDGAGLSPESADDAVYDVPADADSARSPKTDG